MVEFVYPDLDELSAAYLEHGFSCLSGKRAWNWACERVGLCHSMNLEVCEWHERTILGTRVR